MSKDGRGKSQVSWSIPADITEIEEDSIPRHAPQSVSVCVAEPYAGASTRLGELHTGVSTRLGDLHTNMLSAAEVVKYVQKEVAQLKQENDILRKELTLLAGDDRTLRATAGSKNTQNGKDSNGPMAPAAAPAVAPAAMGTPKAPTEPAAILTFGAPEYIEEEVIEEKGSIVTAKSAVTDFKSDPSPHKEIKSALKLKRQATSMLEARGNLKGSNSVCENEIRPGWSVHGNENHARHRRRKSSVVKSDRALRAMLFDPETMKQKMKEAIIKPDTNVNKFYHEEGFAQSLARSLLFEQVTMTVIFLNTLWIAVDTEHNRVDVLLDAHIGFQITEHCFCLFFFSELLVRFLAFERKANCLKSGWFVFDTVLVTTMVFEDWVMTIVLLARKGGEQSGAGVGLIKNGSILRILRLLRLARLGRAVKLMRQSPEVMVMAKAVAASGRCVIWTCVLLACLMFFFGVCFTQLSKDTPLEAKYFKSLTGSLHTLLISGLFPDLDVISEDLKNYTFVYWLLFVTYLLMTTITVMNLLIGVLVEVAQSSARVERDVMDVNYVKEVFVSTLSLWEVEDFQAISVRKEEFADLLQEPEILKALTRVGIDVLGLVDLMDFIFMRGPVGFVELLEVILQLRSSADVTVRDLVEVRKFLTHEMGKLKLEFGRLALMVTNTHEKASEMVAISRARASTSSQKFISNAPMPMPELPGSMALRLNRNEHHAAEGKVTEIDS